MPVQEFAASREFKNNFEAAEIVLNQLSQLTQVIEEDKKTKGEYFWNLNSVLMVQKASTEIEGWQSLMRKSGMAEFEPTAFYKALGYLSSMIM